MTNTINMLTEVSSELKRLPQSKCLAHVTNMFGSDFLKWLKKHFSIFKITPKYTLTDSNSIKITLKHAGSTGRTISSPLQNT